MRARSSSCLKKAPTLASDVDAKIRRFAPTEITADISQLSEGDRKALTKIIEAAKLLDPLFLRQVWSGNEALQKKLAADTSPEGKARLHYFRINVGPWSRLDNKEPFIIILVRQLTGATKLGEDYE